MGIFSKIKEKLFGKKQNEKYVAGLDKSRQTFKGKIKSLFARFKKVDEEYYQELEDLLISSDVGARLSYEIVEATKEEAKYQNITDPDKILELLVEEMYVSYQNDIDLDTTIHYADEGPTIIMMVGVNGVGKTTTIAKLTHRFINEGKKVVASFIMNFKNQVQNMKLSFEDVKNAEIQTYVQKITEKLEDDFGSIIRDLKKTQKLFVSQIELSKSSGKKDIQVELEKYVQRLSKIESELIRKLKVMNIEIGDVTLVKNKK